MMKDYMKNIKDLEMLETIKNADKVSVLVFSANWCPDCKFIEPFMPNLVDQYADYDFYYVDRDLQMNIAQNLMVMGIPSFVALGKGKELARFVSRFRKTESEIDKFLSELCA